MSDEQAEEFMDTLARRDSHQERQKFLTKMERKFRLKQDNTFRAR